MKKQTSHRLVLQTIVVLSFCLLYAAHPAAAAIFDPPDPQFYILSVGVRDEPSKTAGDISATTVYNAFLGVNNIADPPSRTLILDTANAGNKQALIDAIHDMDPLVNGGFLPFVFFINTHGTHDLIGNEEQVEAHYTANSDDRAPTTGAERLYLSRNNPSENMSDDELTALFNTEGWKSVPKLFVIDSCFSGGFWNNDLENVQSSAMLASSSEADKSYGTHVGSDGYLAGNLGQALADVINSDVDPDHYFSERDFPRIIAKTKAKRSMFSGAFGRMQAWEDEWLIDVPVDYRPFAASNFLTVPEPVTPVLTFSGLAGCLAYCARRSMRISQHNAGKIA